MPTIEGDPPLICLGSFDWLPSRDGGIWLTHQIWPRLRERLPGAVLHLAGPGSDTLLSTPQQRVRLHGIVKSPASLLDQRGVVLIPVRAGSGVRLRLLEAWAAGVPVVTTPVGGEGLISSDGDGAVIAETVDEVVAAVERLAVDQRLRRRLVARGYELVSSFRPELVAQQALSLYRQLLVPS